MLAAKHTQSLSEFRQKTTETLNRLDKTGDAEILTVNGEARAVLLSPAMYDELARDAQLSRDVTVMQTALRQIEQGRAQDSDDFFDALRAKLIMMKASNGRHARRGKPL